MTTIKTLKYTPKAKIPLHRLPFISKKSPDIGGMSFWSVPKTGGYGGGCNTGEALAYCYLKHLREHGNSTCGTLQLIALYMLEAGTSDDSIKGQAVGFFSTLEDWLAVGAQNDGASLDKLEEAFLIQQANRGLSDTSDSLNNEE